MSSSSQYFGSGGQDEKIITGHAFKEISLENTAWLRDMQEVRCDMERPVCCRCRRLERPCSFAGDLTDPIKGGLSTHLTPNLLKGTMDEFEAKSYISDQESQNLELMHHFCTSTFLTLTDEAAMIPIWQLYVPRYAFRHRFLLHGILTLAALHRLALNEPADSIVDLREAARAHQQKALSEYIPLLQEIDESNCHALFAFSAILGATSFAFLQSHNEPSSNEEFLYSFLDVFELLQGSTVIAVQGRDWLKQGDLSAWIGPNPFLDVESDKVEPMADMSLEFILTAMMHPENSTDSSADMAARRSTCETSIRLLRALFPSGAIVAVHDKLLGWPALVGTAFMSLLKASDPVALVILAHYGAAIANHNRLWFLHGLGRRLTQAISGILDESWKPYLAWPVASTATS